MVSFPQVSPPEPFAHFSPPPYAPHAKDRDIFVNSKFRTRNERAEKHKKFYYSEGEKQYRIKVRQELY